MTTPEPEPTPTPQSPHLPTNWQGGTFEGHLEPLSEGWYDEQTSVSPDRWALHQDWGPIEPLEQGDPPESWGFDLASLSGGAGAVQRETQLFSGVVARVSPTRTGLVLEEYEGWFNVSKFSKDVDLRHLGTGDVVVVEAEVGGDGRRYVTRILLAQPEVGR